MTQTFKYKVLREVSDLIDESNRGEKIYNNVWYTALLWMEERIDEGKISETDVTEAWNALLEVSGQTTQDTVNIYNMKWFAPYYMVAYLKLTEMFRNKPFLFAAHMQLNNLYFLADQNEKSQALNTYKVDDFTSAIVYPWYVYQKMGTQLSTTFGETNVWLRASTNPFVTPMELQFTRTNYWYYFYSQLSERYGDTLVAVPLKDFSQKHAKIDVGYGAGSDEKTVVEGRIESQNRSTNIAVGGGIIMKITGFNIYADPRIGFGSFSTKNIQDYQLQNAGVHTIFNASVQNPLPASLQIDYIRNTIYNGNNEITYSSLYISAEGVISFGPISMGAKASHDNNVTLIQNSFMTMNFNKFSLVFIPEEVKCQGSKCVITGNVVGGGNVGPLSYRMIYDKNNQEAILDVFSKPANPFLQSTKYIHTKFDVRGNVFYLKEFDVSYKKWGAMGFLGDNRREVIISVPLNNISPYIGVITQKDSEGKWKVRGGGVGIQKGNTQANARMYMSFYQDLKTHKLVLDSVLIRAFSGSPSSTFIGEAYYKRNDEGNNSKWRLLLDYNGQELQGGLSLTRGARAIREYVPWYWRPVPGMEEFRALLVGINNSLKQYDPQQQGVFAPLITSMQGFFSLPSWYTEAIESDSDMYIFDIHINRWPIPISRFRGTAVGSKKKDSVSGFVGELDTDIGGISLSTIEDTSESSLVGRIRGYYKYAGFMGGISLAWFSTSQPLNFSISGIGFEMGAPTWNLKLESVETDEGNRMDRFKIVIKRSKIKGGIYGQGTRDTAMGIRTRTLVGSIHYRFQKSSVGAFIGYSYQTNLQNSTNTQLDNSFVLGLAANTELSGGKALGTFLGVEKKTTQFIQQDRSTERYHYSLGISFTF